MEDGSARLKAVRAKGPFQQITMPSAMQTTVLEIRDQIAHIRSGLVCRFRLRLPDEGGAVGRVLGWLDVLTASRHREEDAVEAQAPPFLLW